MNDLPTDPTIGTSLTIEDKDTENRPFYAIKYQDNFPDLLLEHLSKGLSFYSFDVIGGVTTGSLITWCKKYPKFRAARDIGEKVRLKMLEEEGLKMVKGGNVIAWKFMMNQLGITETVDHNIQHNHSHSPHMAVSSTIRHTRLQKLKELHQRVVLEAKVKEPDYVAIFDI